MSHRFVSSRASVVVATALLVGCGASALPPATPVVASPPPPPPPPPDVTAVAAPENLIVFGRLSNLNASTKVATDWARLPDIGTGELVQGLIEGFTETKVKTHLAEVVDASLPIDYAATMEPRLGAEPDYAIALAVKSLDAAKATLGASYELSAGDNGILRFEARHAQTVESPTRVDEEPSKPCELAPSAGPSAYRLICASSQGALTALGPYLARTTPRQVIPADAHLEVHAQPMKSFGTMARMSGPAMISGLLGLSSATDPAATDLLTAVIGDLLDYAADLDAMTVDATLDPAHGSISFRTTYKSGTSLLARVTTAHPERADVPPAAFSRLPSSVDLAAFGSGIDDADLQRPRELLVAAAREQLKKTKLPPGDQGALVAVLEESIRGARVVMGHGVEDTASYWLVESDDPTGRTAKTLHDGVAAFTRPAVAKWIDDGVPDASRLPTWKLAAPFAGLPKGSLHVELTIPPPSSKPRTPVKGKHGAAVASSPPPAVPVTKPAPQALPEVVHLVVVQDGPRSWLVVSSSEAVIRAELASVTGKASASALLAPGLAALKDTRTTAGGFFTIRSMVEIAREALKRGHAAKRVRWDDILHHLPASGTTPILVTAVPGAPTAEDPGGSYEMTLTLPAEAVRDAVWLGVQLGSM
jgi:hypothetical protein